ncbi:hypothetical protein ScalyP_jg6428 [Parmales sp. scaly parma]|nr:hypothetical protein ScalyP_jg6428 [Parmales sp. scaly parma]
MQTWRVSKQPNERVSAVEDLAKSIISGCTAVGDASAIHGLANLFAGYLTNETERCAFKNALPPPLLHQLPTPKSTTNLNSSLHVDDDAALVLEHICATGRLPDDQIDTPIDIDSRPLFTLISPYFTPTEFRRFRSAILSNPETSNPDSASLGCGFKQTKGFIYRFSRSGICKFKAHNSAMMLLPFFDKAVSSGCNAFVLNVLCCSESTEGKYAVGWHKDATLAFRDGANAAGIKYRLADSVSVLYVAVPDGMVGGELELKDPRASTTTSSNITPKENTCCVFRGDAEHAVHNFFTSNTTQDRVSVVLEQYKVPVGETEWLLEFEKVDQNRYMTTRL